MSLKPRHDRRKLASEYLAAMGIESWELRSATAAAVSVPGASPAGVLPGDIAPDNASALAGYQLGANQLASWLSDSSVEIADTKLDSPPVLVIAESPAMQPTELDLLRSMLGAIKISAAEQCVSQTSDSDTDLNGRDLIEQLCPLIVLLLIRLPVSEDPTVIDVLRNDLQTVSWTRIPVAVSLHPADILANEQLKRPAWEDLKRLKSFLDNR